MNLLSLLTFLLLLTRLPLRPVPIEDGFYRLSNTLSDPVLMTEKGKAVHLECRTSLKITDTQLTSQNNANNRFSLYVGTPYLEEGSVYGYVLVVGGTAYTARGGGSHLKESSNIFYEMNSRQKAEQVARFLKTPLVTRQHPGHQMLVEFVPTKPSYLPGEKVEVTLQITNVGSTPFTFQQGGRNRAFRDNQFNFSAFFNGQQVKDIGFDGNLGGLSITRTLKPGELFEQKISLGSWFVFDKPGLYSVHGSYYLSFHPSTGWTGRPLWEDYATQDFAVTIAEDVFFGNERKSSEGLGIKK